jgi:uncharacterized protein YndB with AHSA1/START domain
MKKTEFSIEYQLKAASINVLWNTIGTPLGLAEWFADGVTVKDNEYTFTWDKSEQNAILLQSKINTFIRFQWEEDIDTDYFFEIRIVLLEVSGDLALLITDFAEESEKSDLIMLWNKQIENMRLKTGI